MSLNELSTDELRERFQGEESTIVTAFSEVDGPEMKTALEFFDLVCEQKEWSKRGECQSVPLEAEVVLEGVLDQDEDSSSNPI